MKLNENESVANRQLGGDTSGACPSCQSHRLGLLGYKNSCPLWRCRACSSIFTNVLDVEQKALTDLYDHYYDHACFEIPPVVAASLDRLIRSFEDFRYTGRLLDIGYGEGAVLEIAERLGWNCYGTEIAPQALEYGKQRGWMVTMGAENDPRFPHQGFDVVTMIELLEHIPAPARFLRMAARWLRPGGLLYITTPNAWSLNRRFLGVEWSIFSPPEHVTIWTARGLSYALAEAGFNLLRVRTEGLNPSEILARLRFWSRAAAPVNRNQAAFALNNAFSRGRFRRALKRGINFCLTTFSVGDTLKVWAIRDQAISAED